MLENGARQRRPTSRNASLRGALFGVLAAFLATLLFVCGNLISAPFDGRGREILQNLEESIAALLIFGLSLFLSLIVPAAAGGSVIALLLHRLSRERTISQRTGILVGTSVGILVSSAIAVSLVVAFPGPGDVEVVIELGGIGLLVGAWHGWRMARWLNNRQFES